MTKLQAENDNSKYMKIVGIHAKRIKEGEKVRKMMHI